MRLRPLLRRPRRVAKCDRWTCRLKCSQWHGRVGNRPWAWHWARTGERDSAGAKSKVQTWHVSRLVSSFCVAACFRSREPECSGGASMTRCKSNTAQCEPPRCTRLMVGGAASLHTQRSKRKLCVDIWRGFVPNSLKHVVAHNTLQSDHKAREWLELVSSRALGES